MKLTVKHLLFVITLFSLITSCNQKKSKIYTEIKEEIIKPENIELLVGTYTDGSSKGIYKLLFNPADGSIESKSLVAEIKNPSFFSISKDKQFVYTVSESDSGKVASFQWNSDRTKLNLISKVSSKGSGLCHAKINNSENLLAVANYGSGNILVYDIENGIIKDSAQIRQHKGSGPVKPNQKSPHAHCTKFGSNGKFIYAVDLGIDQVVSYAINKEGILGKKQTALSLKKGDGPRHLTFHPTKDMAFIINELSCTVTSAKVNQKTGIFEKIDQQSTLPEGYTKKSYCADIHVSSSGKFLYASNRGHNSIAVFSISDEGKLKLLQTEFVHGDWPRNFTLSPDGNHLLVANQKSDNIIVLSINQETGLLTFTGNEIKISKPVCLKF
ncbi:MAG: lactonase family protein [Flavobacteriaceae bacterium]|nr:lactonase family protein [Flavobacteriaceae bacterium]